MKANVALFLFVFCLASAHGSPSVNVQVPQGIMASIDTATIHPQWKVRASIGGWPIDRAWPGSLATESNLGPSYQTVGAPRVSIVSSSISLSKVPGNEGRFGWECGFDLLLINAGALVFIQNRDTNDRALAAELDGRWWQPTVSAHGEWMFSKSESSSWSLRFGILVPFGGGLKVRTTGPLPSLQAVAPEFDEAIVDGTRAAEENLSSLIQDVISSTPIWPSIGIKYTFL